MIRVESQGSFWMIDEDLLRYTRMPKEEKPREDESLNVGVLQDFVWHDFREWNIIADCWMRSEKDLPCLHIRYGTDDWSVLHAPQAAIIS